VRPLQGDGRARFWREEGRLILANVLGTKLIGPGTPNEPLTGCLSWMANTDPFLSMAFETTSGWQKKHVETVQLPAFSSLIGDRRTSAVSQSPS
jgi:hypothetical protein